MIPAAPYTLRLALVAALAVFLLGAARRLVGWRIHPGFLGALAALTLVPVAWRFFELQSVTGQSVVPPALTAALGIAPLVVLASAAGSSSLAGRSPTLAAATPWGGLGLLFLLRVTVRLSSPTPVPADPMLWLMTATMVLLACLGLLLAWRHPPGRTTC